MVVTDSNDTYDVIIIGGGVVGCAILRELSKYRLKLLLIEKEADLAEGISKANSGVIHAGFYVPPGTLKAKLNVAGLKKIYQLAQELNVPHKKTGKLVVALEDSDKFQIEHLKAQGDQNGTPDLAIINRQQMQKFEHLAAGKWALHSPHTGIISPYQFTQALAECAWQNGAKNQLETAVIGVSRQPEYLEISTNRGKYKSQWVINSAGLFSDEIAKMAGITDYTIFPYRGEYHITDRDVDFKLRMPIYPVPPKNGAGLGIHITPTIEGNILLGPSADFIENKQNTASTRMIMDQLKTEAFQLLPELRKLQFIHSFAGVRPKLVDPNGQEKFKDFVIEESSTCANLINLIGIESPGLTASPAIADLIVNIIGQKQNLVKNPQFNPERPAFIRFADLDDATRASLVANNKNWGKMVCRCESVTKAEVLAALNNPLGVKTLDGIKRRTRCGMGRCQGGFCTPRIVEIMLQSGIDLKQITKKGTKSELFFGKIKD